MVEVASNILKEMSEYPMADGWWKRERGKGTGTHLHSARAKTTRRSFRERKFKPNQNKHECNSRGN